MIETPLRYEYVRDDARRRIYVAARYVLQLDDLVAIVDRQVREGAWTYGVLYDLGGNRTISRDDAIAVANHVATYIKTHGPRGPVAVYAKTMEVLGWTQMYAFDGAKRGYRVEVFSDRAAAEQWLDAQQTPPV